VPEYHVVLDPVPLDAFRLKPQQVSEAIARTNRFVPVGMHKEDRQL